MTSINFKATLKRLVLYLSVDLQQKNSSHNLNNNFFNAV